jgi:predicted PurR-regulated permease PerM
MQKRDINHTYFIAITVFMTLYLTWNILQPFISGFLLAYLLYPIHKFLNKYTESRVISAFFIMVIVVFIVAFIGVCFFQFVYTEFIDILSKMPQKTHKLFEFLGFKYEINVGINSVFSDMKKFSFESIFSKIMSYFFLLLYKVLKGNFNIFLEVFSFVYITPISTIFFLTNMHNIEEAAKPLIPSHLFSPIKKFIYSINIITNKFLYSQFLVVVYQIIFYFILLKNIQIPRIEFFLFIVSVGSLIPSFGSVCGLFSFIIVSFIEDSILYEGLFVFILGFIYENYYLIPHFIGGTLGMSSFFIWCSVIICGKLLGVIGFVLAIPLGAVINEFYNQAKIKKENENINHIEYK